MAEKCYTDHSFGKSHVASSQALSFTPEVTVAYLCWQGCSITWSAPHWQPDTPHVPFVGLGRERALLSSCRGTPGGKSVMGAQPVPRRQRLHHPGDCGAVRHFLMPECPLVLTARCGSRPAEGAGPQHGTALAWPEPAGMGMKAGKHLRLHGCLARRFVKIGRAHV